MYNNVIYFHFSHHFHFIPLQIKNASSLSYVDDINNETIQKEIRLIETKYLFNMQNLSSFQITDICNLCVFAACCPFLFQNSFFFSFFNFFKF